MNKCGHRNPIIIRYRANISGIARKKLAWSARHMKATGCTTAQMYNCLFAGFAFPYRNIQLLCLMPAEEHEYRQYRNDNVADRSNVANDYKRLLGFSTDIRPLTTEWKITGPKKHSAR